MIITVNQTSSRQRLAVEVAKFFMQYQKPAILCVGNSKIIGDCFGPLVGESLISKYNIPIHIYGRKNRNITSSSLHDFYTMILQYHDGILVLDSALCPSPYLGTLSFQDTSCVVDILHHPQKIGNFHILANVKAYPLEQVAQLYLVEKDMVRRLVDFTAYTIQKAYLMAKTYKTPLLV